jgi:hypothetical protein
MEGNFLAKVLVYYAAHDQPNHFGRCFVHHCGFSLIEPYIMTGGGPLNKTLRPSCIYTSRLFNITIWAAQLPWVSLCADDCDGGHCRKFIEKAHDCDGKFSL